MNLKIVASNFQLNLVDKTFTMVEENNWFKDGFYSKFTYPITITLTPEIDKAFNLISEIYSKGVNTIEDVFFYEYGNEHEAIFQIESIIGDVIEAQIRYGFEEFPNFNLKLAQFSLHKFELTGETIYEHALDRVNQTYPDTDYFFCQVHTNKFDTDSAQWQYFEGRINNYSTGVFLENEYDVENDEQINRNIIQPIPSLLYLLKTIFLEGGYTLQGDVLTDSVLNKAGVYHLSEFYSSITDDNKQELVVKTDDYYEIDSDLNGFYLEQITLATPGRYKISGNLFLRSAVPLFDISEAKFTFNGNIVASWSADVIEKFILVDLIVEVLPGESNLVLEFYSKQLWFQYIGTDQVFDATILDVTIVQLTAYNADGSPQPTLIAPNEIDLTKCVPDVTASQFFNAIKNLRNYDVKIEGNFVSMNKISKQLGSGIKKDLREYEISNPKRTFNQSKSFELRFKEVSSEEYTFPGLFININGTQSGEYIKQDDTEEIIIDAIPLPVVTKSSITTADGFIDDSSTIQILLYDGLQSSNNICLVPSELTINTIYLNFYRSWFDFLLNTTTFLWTFISDDEFIKTLQVRNTVIAYGILHVVKKLSKTNVANGVVQVEIETQSLD